MEEQRDFRLGRGGLPASEQWNEWVRYLSSRRNPRPLVKLVQPARTHPLKWALPDQYGALNGPTLLEQLAGLSSKTRFVNRTVVSGLRHWLNELPHREVDSLLALECLACSHALPRLGSIVSQTQWRELLGQLESIAEESGGMSLDETPVTHQLLHGELPLTLAYLLPELDACKSLAGRAASALSLGAIELTDGEGLVHARHIPLFHELLACWTRCGVMASAAGMDCFDEDARNQYEWAVRQALRLSRDDGSLLLANGGGGRSSLELIHSALRQGNDEQDNTIAELILPGRRAEVGARKMRQLPTPAVYSEWAEACVMRSKWPRKSPRFSCLFTNKELRTELSNRGQVIWSGSTDPGLHVNGQRLAIASSWTELCWFTDEDVHYLELQADYDDGWKIQRQMLLARHDDFLLLADAVIGPEAAEIRYENRWPIADEIEFLPEDATREGYLKSLRPLCTALPLSLPEWRAAAGAGRFEMADQQLQLKLHASGQRLYAPLFVDLAASRRWLEKRTWRQLTVAERLRIQPADVAVGYRVQLGRQQWLIYRSLAPPANRTLLGQNLGQEFVVGRFNLDGSLSELIEIE